MDLTFKIYTRQSQMPNYVFEQFYALMCLSFPEEERRSREGFLRLCRECPYYKIYTLFEEDKLIAFLTVWEFDFFTFGDHFAVLPQMRGAGIGAKLLSSLKESVKLPFIIEVELPENEMAKRRIGFYERNDLSLCDFDYLLPPMQEGFSPLPMKIMSYPSLLSQEEFEPFKKVIYKTVYNI
ncbi:MAG: GNAT family N-acetyltransferase [Ruminococcaceae bacterium]|nr:GNAT family N-acetyltransferase [Oscillospiraceae bacterium]